MPVEKKDRILKSLGIAVVVWGLLTAWEVSSRPSAPLPAWFNVLCGFSFVGISMACMLKHPHLLTRVLAVVGLGCGLMFLTGPGIESHSIRAVFSISRGAIVMAGLAAMLHFLLLFPAPGPFFDKSRNIKLLYLPAALCWLLVSMWVLKAPEASSPLSIVTYVFIGLSLAGYFLAGISVFLRRFIRMPREERGPKGLRIMLWGSLLGFLPAMIGFMPALSGLPGNEYYFVSLALLPIVWTKAALKVVSKVEDTNEG